MTQPEEYCCADCGSTEVMVEAYCYWDNVTQRFAHYETADDGWDNCSDCGHDRGEFRPITDLKTLARIAIKREEAA